MSPTQTVTQATAAHAGKVWCEVLSGRGVASRQVLGDAAVVVGSDSALAVVVSDPTVSRRHASFEATPRGVRVRDLGSRNGTWYLGASVSEALVPLGATVRLGKALVRFAAADGEAASAPSIAALLGQSAAMVQHRAQLQRVAHSEVAVLLRGETGSGKEAAARAIHAASPRAEAAFVVFDAGHAAGELLDSALFGHRRGAFTGATDSREGAVEAAHGGTLFLDEVGELTAEAQLRLLRVLETRRFTRLGDSAPRTSDFRLMSATQHDLEQRVREKRFREDLFFRLAVVVLDVPPLRQREADLGLLAEHFATQRGLVLDALTLSAWRRREWPGNLRELKNAVERYQVELGPIEAAGARAPTVARAKVMGEVERSLLVEALALHGGDVAAAAKQLGLSRSQAYRLMQRHGIPTRRERGGNP